MKTIFARLSILLAIASAAALPACVGAPDSQDEDTDESSGAMLYGLSESEIASLHPLASRPMSMNEWLDFHRGPFDCANYGDMCEMVGRDAAYSITEQSYHLGLDGATRAEVDAFLSKQMRGAAKEWAAIQEVEHADERDSENNVVYDTGTANDERVKTKVFAVTPSAGSYYAQVECTYQTKGAFGVWGGSANAYLQATVWGHMHDSAGNNYDSSSQYITADIYDHSITTTELYFYPDTGTDDMHAYGTCDAHKGSWSASASTNVVNVE